MGHLEQEPDDQGEPEPGAEFEKLSRPGQTDVETENPAQPQAEHHAADDSNRSREVSARLLDRPPGGADQGDDQTKNESERFRCLHVGQTAEKSQGHCGVHPRTT